MEGALSAHVCGPRGKLRCCRRFAVIASDCDRCDGEGCAQCSREAAMVEDQIAELLPFAPKSWQTEACRDNG